VINISNYTGNDNPPRPRPPTVALVRERAGSRVRDALVFAMGVDWLAYLLRRCGDRWFAMNDTEADWRDRWAAVNRTGALQEAAATAIHRIARIRAGVDSALAREKQAADEKAYREREQEKRAGETKDSAAAATLAPPAPGAPTASVAPAASAASAAPLKASSEKLLKSLDELEKRLWNRPDAKGIPPQDDIMDQLGIVQGAVGGQWDPPSPAQLEALRQLGEQLDRFLADFNRFEAGEVAAFRKQVAEAGIALLPWALETRGKELPA